MKNIHVRFEYQEALDGKKQILSSQMNLLNLLKKVKGYKNIRKRELILKGKFKEELKNLKEEINNIQETFPRREADKEIIIKSKEEYAEEKHKEDVESQLQDIQEKLAKLQ